MIYISADVCFIRKINKFITCKIYLLFFRSLRLRKNQFILCERKKSQIKKIKKCKILKTCFYSTQWVLILSSPIYLVIINVLQYINMLQRITVQLSSWIFFYTKSLKLKIFKPINSAMLATFIVNMDYQRKHIYCLYKIYIYVYLCII